MSRIWARSGVYLRFWVRSADLKTAQSGSEMWMSLSAGLADGWGRWVGGGLCCGGCCCTVVVVCFGPDWVGVVW